MEIFEFLMKRSVLTGLALGVGVSLLSPVIVPAVTRVGKPAAKAVVKAGIVAYERGRELVAEVGEGVEDLYAEARSEMGSRPAAGGEVPAQPGTPG